MNRTPIDHTLKTLILPFHILYPNLKTNSVESFTDFSASGLKGTFEQYHKKIKLLKDTFNTVIISNFHKYSLKTEDKNAPKAVIDNILLFQKDETYFYGIIFDLEADQVTSSTV